MKVNTAKQKMLRGEPAFGYGLGMGSPIAAEYLSNCGIDFILLDNQHGSWGPDSTILALAAMSGGSATPMARVAANNFTLIGRLLDEGLLGIVIPMVHTVEDAKAAAAACRFPPAGERSWGWGRARSMGDDYPQWINEQMFVAIQIESKQAVDNAEAIMAVPGIDGCWIGPGDLSFSMGFHPSEQSKHPEHEAALMKVLQACRNTGKIPGLAAGPLESAIRRAGQGFQFLTAGSDAGFMMAGALAGVKQLHSVRSGG